jgi:hypothetical protein
MHTADATYTVRRGQASGSRHVITKWDNGSRVTYFVECERDWWQKCSCPHFTYRGEKTCKHIMLLNQILSRRLPDDQTYLWQDGTWRVAERLPQTARSARKRTTKAL